MKQVFTILVFVLFATFAFGCTAAESNQIGSSPSSVIEETTSQPNSLSTPAPMPAPTDQVRLLQQPDQVISTQNAHQVVELFRSGNGSAGQAAYSPDGNYLAVAFSAGIQLYDAATLAPVREYKTQSYLGSLAFSPDGKMLAAGSLSDYTVQVWDVSTGDKIYTLNGHNDRVWNIAFSPDGKTLISGGGDSINVWDIDSGKKLFNIYAGVDYEVTCAVFSPDGTTIAFGSRHTVQGLPDDQITLWNIASRSEIGKLSGHENRIKGLSFSPDGKILASSSDDRTVKLWKLPSDQRPLTIFENIDITNVIFSPDGKTLAIGIRDSQVVLWNTVTQKTERLLPWHPGYIAFSPDGKALISSLGSNVELWDLSNDKLQTIEYFGGSKAAISPDGKTIAISGSETRLWDVTTNEELRSLKGADSVLSMDFSPDGKTLATAAKDNLIQTWNVATGDKLYTLHGHSNKVKSVAFSPDGKWLASGSWDSTARLWNVTTGEQERVYVSSSSPIIDGSADPISVAFSPDGKLLAAGLTDNRIALWDVATGEEILTFGEAAYNTEISSVAFSPDGKTIVSGSSIQNHYLASGGTNVKLWDVATGQELHSLNDAGGQVAFSPDGNLLAVGKADGTIGLIDIARWGEVSVLSGHVSSIANLAFSLDGKMLISSSGDQTIRVWGIPPTHSGIAPTPATDLISATPVASPTAAPSATRADTPTPVFMTFTPSEKITVENFDRLRLWRTLIIPEKIYQIAFSPNDKWLTLV